MKMGLAILASFFWGRAWAGKPALEFGGAGWMEYGFIMHSLDTAQGQDLNRKGSLASGAQILVTSNVSERLSIRAGLGVIASHFIAGSRNVDGGYAPMNAAPYVAEADFQYSILDGRDFKMGLGGGLLPFDYLPENRNLGLYLLRGPVYPGILYSGFETKDVMPVANLLALHLDLKHGNLAHDFILSSETELFPFFDLSPAYLLTYERKGAFRIGGGVNFYHLIPIDDSLTNDRQWYYVDTLKDAGGSPVLDGESNVRGDTTYLSFQGIKVTVHASFDPKSVMGDLGVLGEEDLRVYGEVALIGLENDKAHRAIYGDIGKRIPKMLGFNLPAFKVLDHLSLELEWYAAPFRDDLNRYATTNGNQPSPKPVGDEGNLKDGWIDRDNFKWSVHGERTFADHIRYSFQVARDHYRPGVFTGYGDNNPPSRKAVLFGPQDWYWMTKIAYFF